VIVDPIGVLVLVAAVVGIVVPIVILFVLMRINDQLRYANWLAHKRLVEIDKPGITIPGPPL
jgi:multisubunit Na+/H+ antiporter MnhC subunit